MPPIPFPWKRAIPGIVLTTLVLAWGAVEIVRYIVRVGAAPFPSLDIQLPHGLTPTMQQAEWVLAALAISAAGCLLSRRLAGRSGLL